MRNDKNDVGIISTPFTIRPKEIRQLKHKDLQKFQYTIEKN